MKIDRRVFGLGTLAAGFGLTANQISAGENRAMSFEVTKTEEEWRKLLTPEQYYVLRKHGTERAHTSPLDKTYTEGVYVCAGCGQVLFSSQTKFNSGTGWPSFYAPVDGKVGTSSDRSFFMVRTEVHCSRCGGHLGHVFNDGPKPTGLRYCINGVSLDFEVVTEPSNTADHADS
jgi:peptide-methionine (R)-S-oxide reductase